MKRLWIVVVAVLLVSACKKADDGGGSGSGSNNEQVDAAIPAMTTDVSSDVMTNTTWSGLIKVHTAIKVATGVTLTVDPGSVIQLDAAAGITVNGTVTINGAKGNVVTIGPATGNHYWRSWSVATGTLNMTYVQQTGGAISITGTATLMVRDSQFSNAGAYPTDLLVISGGTTDVQYSWIGTPEGQPDITHCDMHLEGGNPTVKVSHSNISTAAVAVMFYTGHSVDFTYNNWFGNQADMDKSGATTGDVSFGYFKAGNPTASASLTQNSMATGMLTDAGPR